MTDSFGTAVSFILLAVMLFLVPTLYLSIRQDSITQNVVNYETADFINSVKSSGNITKRTYEDFLRNLDRTGNLYTIEIEHQHKVMNPETNYDGNPVLDENGEIKVAIQYDSTYEEDILKELYEKSGIYHMDKDDYISIKVVNRNRTLGTKIQQFFIGVGIPTEQIYTTFGGIIRDET